MAASGWSWTETKCLGRDINLRDVGLEGAVKGPGLHVFGGESLFSEHVQTEAFPGRTEVLVNFLVVLWTWKRDTAQLGLFYNTISQIRCGKRMRQ